MTVRGRSIRWAAAAVAAWCLLCWRLPAGTEDEVRPSQPAPSVEAQEPPRSQPLDEPLPEEPSPGIEAPAGTAEPSDEDIESENAEPGPAETEEMAPEPAAQPDQKPGSEPAEPSVPAEEAPSPQAPRKQESEEAYDYVELITEVMLHIRKQYVTDRSYKEIAYGALHGMLRGLDEYSDFLEPLAYTEIQDDTTGQFSGIGIHIGIRDGILTVIAPIEDTPAFRAGLLSGDKIVEINGERTMGLNLRDAVERLRGPSGSEVTVAIRRRGENEPIVVTIKRDNIEVPSVKGARIIKDGVGYVRLTNFSGTTGEALGRDLEQLKKEGVKALVLDLRDNPGGLLRAAVEVAQKFLKKGMVVVATRGREGVQDESAIEAGGDMHWVDKPMVVLVNGGSASASEIVAGALQDYKRAVLIGERTFGKGSVQSVIRMKPEGDSAIRLTTAYYHTPSGRQIHNKGIDPDIVVPVLPQEWRQVLMKRAYSEMPGLYTGNEAAQYTNAVDRQLERAVDLLTGLLIFEEGQ